jgi:hypothetical protein
MRTIDAVVTVALAILGVVVAVGVFAWAITVPAAITAVIVGLAAYGLLQLHRG